MMPSTSAGVPARPTGMRPTIAARASGSSLIVDTRPVSVYAGITVFTRMPSRAYAADGIRVNAVVPAYTETGLVSTISDDPESRAAIVGRIPLGRAGTPADVEGIMVFLASADGEFATGGLFAVDGGMTTL